MIALVALAMAPGFGEFTLTDLQSRPYTVRAADARATVVVFLSTVCPISQKYERRFVALFDAYAERQARFVFVYSNRNETPAEIRQHAAEGKFPFPVYRDPDNTVADLFAARVTPTAVIVDVTGRLAYRGRVDDAVEPARVRDRSLENALRAVLAGKPVKAPETKAFG